MCSAVILRIFENGSTRSPGHASTRTVAVEGGTTVEGDRGRSSVEDGRGRSTTVEVTAAAPLSMWLRISCLVTRPAIPEPGIVEIST
jgi:hypothetical protein